MARKKADHSQFGPRGVGYRIKVLSLLLGRRLQFKLDKYGLTPAHWLVLNCLSHENGLAISALGEQLQQVGGTMTGVIDRMEERDLIYRERDADDRRIWRAWLTDKGSALAQSLPPLLAKQREHLLEGISSQDFACFERVLAKLTVNAQADLDQRERT